MQTSRLHTSKCGITIAQHTSRRDITIAQHTSRREHQDCTAHLEASHASYAHLPTPSFPLPLSPPLPPSHSHLLTPTSYIPSLKTSSRLHREDCTETRKRLCIAFHQVRIPSPPLCINDPYHQRLLPAPTISEDDDVAITAPSSSLAQRPPPLSAGPDVNVPGFSSASYFQSFIPFFANTDLQ